MARGYSNDLRERVVAIVQDGKSAREAARLLNIGTSTAIRWIGRWTKTGSVAAKPGTGHIRSPLKQHVVARTRCRGARSDAPRDPCAAAVREEDEVCNKLDLGILRSSQHNFQKKLRAPQNRIALMLLQHALS
jgi:transposase